MDKTGNGTKIRTTQHLWGIPSLCTADVLSGTIIIIIEGEMKLL